MTAAANICVAALHSLPLFFFNKTVLTNLFILLFLAALGLVVARRFSLVAASRGLHSRCRPAIAVASLVAEHRL